MSGPDARRALPTDAAATHAGTVREHNEDCILARADLGLWAVADGAGGHGMGEVASRAVVDAIEAIPAATDAAELLPELRRRLTETHDALRRRAEALGEGRIIATTVVALMARAGHFACLWAGDSRAYLLREGALQRLTRDHSLVQEMVDAGMLAEADAEAHPQANIILRAVGGPGEIEFDKVSGICQADDRFLLCSDGLFKAIPEAELGDALRAGKAAQALVADAVARGARDNVSAVTIAWPA